MWFKNQQQIEKITVELNRVTHLKETLVINIFITRVIKYFDEVTLGNATTNILTDIYSTDSNSTLEIFKMPKFDLIGNVGKT